VTSPKNTRLVLLALATGLAAVPFGGAAFADPGEHVVVGDTVITPKVSVGAETSSNPYHLPDTDGNSAAVAVRVTPAIDVNLTRDDLEAGAYAQYDLRAYVTNGDQGLNRFNEFEVGGFVDALRDSTVGFRLSDGLSQRLYATSSDPDSPYARRLHNDAQASLVLRPREEAEIALGGRYLLDDYGVPDLDGEGTQPFSTRHTVGPAAQVGIAAAERLTLAATFNLDFMSYSDDTAALGNGTTRALADGTFLRALAGIRSEASDRVLVTLLAGYGGATFGEAGAGPGTNPTTTDTTPTATTGTAAATVDADEADPSADISGIDHLLVNASIAYAVSDRASATLGYEKDFRAAYITNAVAYNRGYVGADLRFTEDFGLAGEFSATGQNFIGTETRNDVFLQGSLDASVYLQDWGSFTFGAAKRNRTSTVAAVAYDETIARVYLTLIY
jgi:hypothetical protein